MNKDILYICFGIGLLAFGVFGGAGLFNYLSNNDNGDGGRYDYCIEYDGFIDRNNMFNNCWDRENNKLDCQWIASDEALYIFYDSDNKIDAEFNCSRYVKSKEVTK